MTHYVRNGDDIDRGLVAYYKLDDLKSGPGVTAIIDQSSNFNDGIITGGTSSTDIRGRVNHAISFDGSTTTVDIPNTDVDLDVKTICLRIKTSTLNQTNVRVLAAPSGFTNDWSIVITSRLVNYAKAPGGGNARDTDVNVVNSDEWLDICVTDDGAIGTSKIYINGELADSAINASNLSVGAGNFQIGSRQGADRFFDGIISSVKVYNRILTNGEISKLSRLRI